MCVVVIIEPHSLTVDSQIEILCSACANLCTSVLKYLWNHYKIYRTELSIYICLLCGWSLLDEGGVGGGKVL